MEEKILKVLRTVLEDSTLDRTCSQENHSTWDSLHHLNVCFSLESEFGIMFTPEEMGQMKSFDEIVTVVSSKF